MTVGRIHRRAMHAAASSFPVHRGCLKNGLRTLVIPMAGTSAVSFFLAVRTGSRNETADSTGLSHFLEHLFFKGSKKRPSTREISEVIDGVGGEMNAFTGKEATAFYAKAAYRHADLVVDVISDMVLHPLLDPKEIDRERGVIIEEMNMYEDTPMRTIGELFEETVFGPHALARPIIGTKEVIRRVPRTTILRYLRAQYRAETAVACLAGNIDPADGETVLKRALGKFPAGKAKLPVRFQRTYGRERVRVKEKKTDQTHVMIGAPGVHYLHEDRPALDLLATILGGGMSSRLFIEVRERRGLAYSVRTMTDHFVDAGTIATQAGVDTGKFLDACRVVVAEYGKLRARKVVASELEKAREFIKGKLLLGLETADETAQFAVGQEVLLNRIVTPEEIFRLLDAVKPQDIQRVARQYLKPDALRLVTIGPGAPHAELRTLLEEV